MITSSVPQSPVGRPILYFGALGGAVAWTLHLLLAYLIAEFGCETEADRFVAAGITLPAWLLLGMSAVMLLGSAASTGVAWRCWRRLRPLEPTHDRWLTVDIYLARGGLMASGLFTFIIIVQSIPIFFYLRSC